MSRELDDAMAAIPNVTDEQIQVLIDFQIAELARYNVKGTKAAKKDQSEDDVQAALDVILGTPQARPAARVSGFKRRF
jgi:hypothetical protein